jgi:hypothetical protein
MLIMILGVTFAAWEIEWLRGGDGGVERSERDMLGFVRGNGVLVDLADSPCGVTSQRTSFAQSSSVYV